MKVILVFAIFLGSSPFCASAATHSTSALAQLIQSFRLKVVSDVSQADPAYPGCRLHSFHFENGGVCIVDLNARQLCSALVCDRLGWDGAPPILQ